MREIWLCHYDLETKQQSMEWRHNGSTRPALQKIPVQKSTGKVLASIFFGGGSRRHPPHWLSSKGPNCQRGVLLISVGAIDGHFEGKTSAAGRSPKGSCSCTAMPRLTGHLQPRKPGLPGLPMSRSPTLFFGYDPVGLPPVLWSKKDNWNVAIFLPTRRSLLPRRPGLTDNILNFFLVARRSYNNGLRSVLSFVGSMLNKCRVWSL